LINKKSNLRVRLVFAPVGIRTVNRHYQVKLAVNYILNGISIF